MNEIITQAMLIELLIESPKSDFDNGYNAALINLLKRSIQTQSTNTEETGSHNDGILISAKDVVDFKIKLEKSITKVGIHNSEELSLSELNELMNYVKTPMSSKFIKFMFHKFNINQTVAEYIYIYTRFAMFPFDVYAKKTAVKIALKFALNGTQISNFNEVVDNFMAGNKLMSVKLIKEATGYDLKTSKEILDKCEQKLNE